MTSLPLWVTIPLYTLGIVALAALLYAVIFLAVRQALRQTADEARTARRRQEDLLRELSTSATYIADVADAWAESEADRRSEAERVR